MCTAGRGIAFPFRKLRELFLRAVIRWLASQQLVRVVCLDTLPAAIHGFAIAIEGETAHPRGRFFGMLWANKP